MVKETKTLGAWFITGFKGMLTGIVSVIIMWFAFFITASIKLNRPVLSTLIFITLFIAQIPLWGFIANRFWGWK